MKKLSFYFDYLSPYSYFAFLRLPELHPHAEILFKPVAMGTLFNHWGIKGPGEVDPKREFLLKQMLRHSRRNKISFTTPKTHPFNSLYALRLSLKGVAGEHQPKVIETLWKAGWQERLDMGEPDELLAALKRAGLPADDLYEKSFTREAKVELKGNIQEAITHGVFGVPSFVEGSELFWGQDSLPDLIEYLQGRDSLDREKLTNLLASTPRAAAQQL